MTDRKLICLQLVERTNGIKIKPTERCTSERVPGSSLCAHHLASAVQDYHRLVEEHGGETP